MPAPDFSPPGASGFSLLDGSSRTLVFQITGREKAPAVLKVSVRGEATPGGQVLRTSASTELVVGPYFRDGGAPLEASGGISSCSAQHG